MRLDMSQQARMLQQMKLAPRMIQSMEILQLPAMALEERIREEAEQNIALELGSSTTETATTDLEPDLAGTAGAERTERDGPTDQEREAIEKLVEEWDENYLPSYSGSRLAGIEASEKKHEAMQNMADRPASLEDHLLEQIAFEEEDPQTLEFARFIIANLNGRGFLNGPFEELRQAFEHRDIDVEGNGSSSHPPLTDLQAERALKLVQSCDPPGIGARDLRECLLLQLEDEHVRINHAEVLREILNRHYDDLQHNRLPAIERKTGLPIETVAAAIDDLRHLDLNPGGRFVTAQSQYVIPDVVIERDADGAWIIKMNEINMPRVSISKEYLMLAQRKDVDPKTYEYVKKKITAAKWLLESIEQRRNTLEKVTRAIIDHQREFLDKGPDFIEPLKMQQIADRVGVHVTTVSRAVDDKWVQTPRGVFPLRKFFGGGTLTSSGEEVAWDAIKRKLTEVVANEDKSNPCSDDELVKRMKDLGYPLARRTVTKYRKMLDIPTSRQRKHHV